MKNYTLRILVSSLTFMLAGCLLSCSSESSANQDSGTQKNPSAESDTQVKTEYTKLQSELVLAQSKKPYLVLDLPKRQLEIKLGGAIVWAHALIISDTSASALRDFSRKLEDSDVGEIRHVKEKHLYASKAQSSDSMLSIVGNALNIDPKLLQRELPEKFQLVFDDGFVMEFHSAVEGTQTSVIKNTYLAASQALQRLFGDVYMVTTIEPAAAMTLYRAADKGVPLLVQGVK